MILSVATRCSVSHVMKGFPLCISQNLSYMQPMSFLFYDHPHKPNHRNVYDWIPPQITHKCVLCRVAKTNSHRRHMFAHRSSASLNRWVSRDCNDMSMWSHSIQWQPWIIEHRESPVSWENYITGGQYTARHCGQYTNLQQITNCQSSEWNIMWPSWCCQKLLVTH